MISFMRSDLRFFRRHVSTWTHGKAAHSFSNRTYPNPRAQVVRLCGGANKLIHHMFALCLPQLSFPTLDSDPVSGYSITQFPHPFEIQMLLDMVSSLLGCEFPEIEAAVRPRLARGRPVPVNQLGGGSENV